MSKRARHNSRLNHFITLVYRMENKQNEITTILHYQSNGGAKPIRDQFKRIFQGSI